MHSSFNEHRYDELNEDHKDLTDSNHSNSDESKGIIITTCN